MYVDLIRSGVEAACGVCLRLEQRAEVETSMSAQSLVPGEIVDREWFNK